MTRTHTLMLTLAIASALATTACNRDAATDPAATAPDAAATDPAATDAMTPADGAMAPADGAMAPADGAMAPADGSAPMTPPTAAASTTSTATVSANDANADGELSMDELPQGDMLREHFSAADGDGNGMLSQAEIDKHNATMAANPAPAQ